MRPESFQSIPKSEKVKCFDRATVAGSPGEALDLSFVARYTDARKEFDGQSSGRMLEPCCFELPISK